MEPMPLWTVKEAAVQLGTTVHSIYKLTERRQIPHLRIGKRIRFDPVVIAAWLKEHEVPADWGGSSRTSSTAPGGGEVT